MKLILDVREKQLIQLIKALQKSEQIDFTLEIDSIPLGDAIIVDETSNKERLIIERKSLQDLASSIIDGRYKEQSHRLHHESLHNHNIMYVIEGHMEDFLKRNYSKRINENTLYSAMFTLNYYKGFSVIRTYTILETATWIIRIMDKMHRMKDESPFYDSQNDESNSVQRENTVEKPYSAVVKRVKKDNICPENVGEIILSQIPGISTATSLAIMTQFGSLYNLMMELKKDRSCLNSVTYTTKSNQQRHISKSAIQSIITYLLYQKQEIIQVDTSCN